MSFNSSANDADKPSMVLKFNSKKKAGMFAVVNLVAEFARCAAEDNRRFVVKWWHSLYRQPGRKEDPWLYYFEPVFKGAELDDNPPLTRQEYPNVVHASHNVIQRRLVHGVRDALGLPADRAAGHAMLERFIQLNAPTQAFVDDFAATFFDRPVIGLHLRGPGRVHGGALQLRAYAQPDGSIPYDLYFDAVDAALEKTPDALIFACSDSQQVIETVRARYGKRTLVYPATRSNFGEMHDNHPENKGAVFAPYKLGLDVIVEAHLLARCVHFVHGNSNVSNYVLCRAPEMPSTYVYAHLEDQLVTDMTRASQEEPLIKRTA